MEFSKAYSPGTAIEAGWNAVKRAPVALLVGCLLLVVTSSHYGIRGHLEDLPRWAWDYLGLAVLGGGIWTLLLFPLEVFVTSGYYRVAGRAIYGQRPSFERLFGSGDRFLDMLLWQILRIAILVLTALVLALPLIPLGVFGGVAAIFGGGDWDWPGLGFLFGALAFLYIVFFSLPVFLYVELGLYFGPFLVALEGKGPGDALRESWGLASRNRLWLLFYRAVMFVVASAGVFALFIGYFVTRSITDAGAVGAFLALRKGAWPTGTETGRPAGPRSGGPVPPVPPAPPGSGPRPDPGAGAVAGPSPGADADARSGSSSSSGSRSDTEPDFATDPDRATDPGEGRRGQDDSTASPGGPGRE